MIGTLAIAPHEVAALPLDAAGLYAGAALLGARVTACEVEIDDGELAILTFSSGWSIMLVHVAITSATYCEPRTSTEPNEDGVIPLGRAVLHVRATDA